MERENSERQGPMAGSIPGTPNSAPTTIPGTLPVTINPAPTTSSRFDANIYDEPPKEPKIKRIKKFIHNSENGTYCSRTVKSWLQIIAYAIVYFMFLSTFTMILLYSALIIIKNSHHSDKPNMAMFELLTYPETGIGLTGTPTAEYDFPLIWYREGQSEDYHKYIEALDVLLQKDRTKRELGANLGPCANSPYGYGEKPCVVFRINKQLRWTENPLAPDSPKAAEAPEEVRRWMQKDRNKYWLHCSGFHSYDKEHIRSIKYYPDPPGFDAAKFPIPVNGTSPMVAIQISDFTLGLSLAIECKLWYANGVSTLDFLLYVMPKNIRHTSRSYYTHLRRRDELGNDTLSIVNGNRDHSSKK